ncbi:MULTISPECIES: hypothetical protein [Janibacter]|uniref:Uncharacterized protein n=1 Tax=Janibacter indicus TaxID=857417 RepID=A0A1W1ZBN8_9MICO|nr:MULTISPECIES: hypothetical protein [Janibacter]QNF94892.1 hypothetical protein H7A72_03595 [Janibacter sp. YB324]SMC45849.1 hypothetical protein SAMN06296429_103304 [Janibacter indicus]
MSQTWYDDHNDLEAALATALHSADVPDLSPDLDDALRRGRRVVPRRPLAAVTAGAAAALLRGLGIVSATTLGPAETPPASTTSVRSGTVELADVMVLGDGAGGYLTYAVVRGEPSGVRGFAGDDEDDLVDSRSRHRPAATCGCSS